VRQQQSHNRGVAVLRGDVQRCRPAQCLVLPVDAYAGPRRQEVGHRRDVVVLGRGEEALLGKSHSLVANTVFCFRSIC